MKKFNFILLFCVFIISSCVTYKPMPIYKASIQKTTQNVDFETIKKLPNGNTIVLKLMKNEPLSINEMAKLVLNLNPVLKVARDKLMIVKAQIEQSKEIPNPTLSGNIGFPIAGNIKNTYDSYSLGSSFDLSWIIKRNSKIKSAMLEFQSQKLSYDYKAYSYLQEAKLTAANIYYLNEINKLAQQKVDIFKKVFDAVKEAYNKNLMTIGDYELAKNEHENAKIQYIKSYNALLEEKHKLNNLLGLPVTYNLNINFKPEISQIPPLSSLQKNIYNRLDIVAFNLAYDSQEERLRQAILEQFPRFSINIPFSRDNSNVQTLNVGVSIDFPIFNTNKAQIEIQKATRQKMYDEYVSRVIAAKFDTTNLYSQIIALQQENSILQTSLKFADKLSNYYRQAFKDNNINLLQYYKNENNLLDKKCASFNLDKNLYTELIALEISSGVKILR